LKTLLFCQASGQYLTALLLLLRA